VEIFPLLEEEETEDGRQTSGEKVNSEEVKGGPNPATERRKGTGSQLTLASTREERASPGTATTGHDLGRC